MLVGTDHLEAEVAGALAGRGEDRVLLVVGALGRVVEQGGQQHAASWTRQDENRLEALVRHAHAMGLWIRFYTLNGHSEAYGQQHGWNRGYNFGSKQQVTKRWRAAIRAGADYVATDQYEEFAELLRALRH